VSRQAGSAFRTAFLLDAMRHSATALDDSVDDFRREAALP